MIYRIPAVWQMTGICVVEAESLDEAIKKAEDGPLPDYKVNYIDGSFEIDMEGIPFYNNLIES